MRKRQPGYEAKGATKRIKSHKGVRVVLIVNQEGVLMSSSTSDEEFAMVHTGLISQLAATVRTLELTDDRTFCASSPRSTRPHLLL